MTAPRPTSAKERLHALDAIRGVAILGVLAAYTVWSLGNPPETSWSAADRVVARGMSVFVDNKFLSLFTFLFGLGVTQQWRRWTAAGADPLPLHLRRMGCLLGIGLLHAVFLRNGDILVPYALMGLALLAFRRAPDWVVALVAAMLVFVPTVASWAAPHLGIVWPERPSHVDGGYLRENLAWLRHWYVTLPLLGWPRILALMLAGTLAGRARLPDRLVTDPGLTRRCLAVSLSIAVLARIALDQVAGADAHPGTGILDAVLLEYLAQVGVWSLSATYALALIRMVGPDPTAPRLRPLRAVGRMAFTNYLTQALVAVPLCLAFGLFDRVSPTLGLVLAIAIGALQMAFSHVWLARHAMGPFEGLWRAATYGGPFRGTPGDRTPDSATSHVG